MEKIVTTFCQKQITSISGYRHTIIIIREMLEEDLQSVLEGTIGNKAGYGTMEAANAIQQDCQVLLDQGHTRVFSFWPGDLLNVRLQWQHFNENEYCEVRFEDLGRSFTAIKKGIAFLEKIGRKIERERVKKNGDPSWIKIKVNSYHTFARPETLVEMCKKKKFIEVTDGFPQKFSTFMVEKNKIPAVKTYSLTG